MGRVHGSPAVLGGFDEFEGHRHTGGAGGSIVEVEAVEVALLRNR